MNEAQIGVLGIVVGVVLVLTGIVPLQVVGVLCIVGAFSAPFITYFRRNRGR